MPVVVRGINLPRLCVEPAREVEQPNSGRPTQREHFVLSFARPVTHQTKPEGKSGKSKSAPRKKWEQCGLRLAGVVYAIDVGFDLPRQPVRLPGGPQQRSQQRNSQS